MRQTRAALLPFTGDPFLLKEWLRLFKTWGDEVDKLYILMNVKSSEEIVNYCQELIFAFPAGKTALMFRDKNIDHGPAINEMLNECTEDLVMLIEEDGFIFQKGQVDACFNIIEESKADIVASERGSTTEEVIRMAGRKWGCEYPAFWPNFFFCKRADLLKTDRHFQAKSWNKGDYIKELDLTVSDLTPADTFVWTSLQLRNMGLRVSLVPQYHSCIEDIQDFVQIKGIFDRKAPWVHIGSLSGWQNDLFSANLPPRIGEIEEWERRAAAWVMFWEDAQESLPESMKDFSTAYKAGIDRLIDHHNLSLVRVKKRVELFRYLLNPELYVKLQAQENKI